MFRAAWKDFKSRFQHLLDDLRRHKELVENQANLLQFQESRALRLQFQDSFKAAEKTERENRRLAVMNWLSAADAHLDQEGVAMVRHDYPGTCRWIIEKPELKAWYDPEDTLVRLIWLKGIPGAGSF
jgi:hypothetical protein